jgi:hypothetical protein
MERQSFFFFEKKKNQKETSARNCRFAWFILAVTAVPLYADGNGKSIPVKRKCHGHHVTQAALAPPERSLGAAQ